MEWNSDMSAAPKDGTHILVWYDHEADTYHDPESPHKLTDYAAWAEGGDFMDGKGYCIAAWMPQYWESVDEYGDGYWMPAWWFMFDGCDYERTVNPTHWAPLTPP